MKPETYLTVQEYRSKKGVASAVIKILAIAASVYGMCMSFQGWISVTYYTNLSNIFMDIVLFGFMVHDIKKIKKGGRTSPPANGWYAVKFMATTSITLTFFVYLALLAPTNPEGFAAAYLKNYGGSLCVHCVAPLLAVLDFILFDYYYESSRLHIFFAMLPPYVYMGLVALLAENGVRWGENMYAPYNFMNYGAPTGWFGFDASQVGSATLGTGVAYNIIVLSILFMGVGACFLAIKNRRRRKMLNED